MLPANRDDAELLSSGSTTFWKRVFPAAWTVGLGAFVVAIWFDLLGQPHLPEMVKGALVGGWALLSGLMFRWFGQLERVWLDADSLVVGDSHRGTRVSLRDVCEVKESRLQRVKTVTLKLSRPTPLGTRITFIPKGSKEVFLPWADSAVAAALRERVERLADPAQSRALHD